MVDATVPVEIVGVPVAVAVAGSGEWPGVYVAEEADPRDRPDALVD